MKKFICVSAAVAVGIFCAFSFGGCQTGEARVEYTLSEDKTYYIVSGVSGDKLGLTSYEIPAQYSAEEGGELLPVKEIGNDAFMQCFYLEDVTLPDSIEKIGERAFAKCGFTKFVIPESVTYIGFAAFGACEYLSEITVPESVTTLEPRVFVSCPALKKAYVRANITVLDYGVFYNPSYSQGGETYYSTSLTELHLPATLQKIHKEALEGNFLTDIYFDGTRAQWDELYFYNMVDDEENEGEKKENRLEKSDVLGSGTEIHCKDDN